MRTAGILLKSPGGGWQHRRNAIGLPEESEILVARVSEPEKALLHNVFKGCLVSIPCFSLCVRCAGLDDHQETPTSSQRLPVLVPGRNLYGPYTLTTAQQEVQNPMPEILKARRAAATAFQAMYIPPLTCRVWPVISESEGVLQRCKLQAKIRERYQKNSSILSFMLLTGGEASIKP